MEWNLLQKFPKDTPWLHFVHSTPANPHCFDGAEEGLNKTLPFNTYLFQHFLPFWLHRELSWKSPHSFLEIVVISWLSSSQFFVMYILSNPVRESEISVPNLLPQP